MTTRRKTGQSSTSRFLEQLMGHPLTLGKLLGAIRTGEGMTQTEFASRLGVSRSNLCDIEKGRKTVSPARAARLAKALGHSETQFVRLALQGMVDEAGLELVVKVEAV
jgi:transcriptional regulator with XRE-family HTH domain